MNSKTIKMQAIDRSGLPDHAIVYTGSTSPIMRGQGSVTYTCPACGLVIFENVTPRYYSKLAIKCGACRTISVVPPAPGILR